MSSLVLSTILYLFVLFLLHLNSKWQSAFNSPLFSSETYQCHSKIVPGSLPTENVLVPPLDSAAHPHANPKHLLFCPSFHRMIIFKYFSTSSKYSKSSYFDSLGTSMLFFRISILRRVWEAEEIDNILIIISPCPPLVASHTNYSSKALITCLDWHDLTVLVVRCTHFSWVTLKHQPGTISPPQTASLIDQKHLIKNMSNVTLTRPYLFKQEENSPCSGKAPLNYH